MAQCYTGPKFWSRQWVRESCEVTVKTTRYKNRQTWIIDMEEWAHKRGMKIEWMGESTHNVNDNEWHQAHFFIPNEGDRMLFALRWSE
jgi:hypothetical protein